MSEQQRVGPIIPAILDRVEMPNIELRMALPRPDKPSVPSDHLDGETFMLGHKLAKPDCDYSLTSQLPGLLETNPDGLIFTAYSSIPTADVFRGIYELLGIPLPKLAIAYTNNAMEKTYVTRPELRNAEAQRLKNSLKNIGSVAVIDQCSLWGSTCERTRQLLKGSNIACVGIVMGDWYIDAHRAQIDTELITSPFADEMRAIGRRIGSAVLAKI